MTSTAQATSSGETVAQGLLSALHENGVEYVFANAGSDFGPIIEGIAKFNRAGARIPNFITVPHENVAVAMAQGYFQISGKPAAVMVHVNVGTANTMAMLMNASRDNDPMLLMAGRTPITEVGYPESRNLQIHWGQESFDQGAMLREYVKWDYELRTGQPVDTIIGRALDISMSEPRGPVYLTLPREVLGENCGARTRYLRGRSLGNFESIPTQAAIEAAAMKLASAENPLIITGKHNGGAAMFEVVSRFANAFSIPVTQVSEPSLLTSDAMNLGFRPGSYLKAADVIVVIACAVPWIPSIAAPASNSTIIQIAPDPLYARFPFRGFRSDLPLTGSPIPTLNALHEALSEIVTLKGPSIESRRKRIGEDRQKLDAGRKAMIEKARTASSISTAWLTHCVNQVRSKTGIVCPELGLSPDLLEHVNPRGIVTTSYAGALGFSLGGGLGAKIAARDREVITAVGDGSYMFGCPAAAHFVGQASKLPTLTIIANNSMWLAVKTATLSVCPDGAASEANAMPLTELTPSPAFEKMIEACGGYGEAVEDPATLIGALERALDKVHNGQQALLNVHTERSRG